MLTDLFRAIADPAQRAAMRIRQYLAPNAGIVAADGSWLPGLRPFERYYFPHLIVRPPSWLHDWMTRQLYRACVGRAWVIGEFFRGLGKTTVIRIAVIFAVALGRKRHVVICSPNAKEILAGIAEELTENAALIRDFGASIGAGRDFKNQLKGFNDKRIVLKNGAVISAKTPGENIRGALSETGVRIDFLIFDDLLKEGEIDSRAAREKVWEWFNRSTLPALKDFGKNASIVYLDTFKHRDAPSSRKIREIQEKESDGRKTPWVWLNQGAKGADGKLIFLTEEDYQNLQDLLDPLSFRREVLGEDVSDEAQLFFPEFYPTFDASTWVVPKNRSERCRVRLHIGDHERDLAIERSAIFIDPSIGFSDENPSMARLAAGDWFAISVLGRTEARRKPGRPYYACPEVRAAKVVGDDFDPITEHVVELAIRYRPNVVIIESNAAQKLFVPGLRKALRKAGFRGTVVGKPSKGNKFRRINDSNRELSEHEVHFGSRMPVLFFEQYEAIRAVGSEEHDDIPDSIAGALAALRVVKTGIVIGGRKVVIGGDEKETEA